MKCAVEMGLGALIYVPGFIKTSSAIQELLARYRYRQQGNLISLLLFLKIKKVG
jgi:hypothetical protein